MRFYISLFLCLFFATLVQAQDSQRAYQDALERIRAAEASGATELNLYFLGLTELPPEIGNLVNLQALYAGGNDISTLPVEITHLSNLQVLDLSDNQLS